MKQFVIFSIFIFLRMKGIGQDPTVRDLKKAATIQIKKDTTIKADKNGWLKGGLFNVSFTQISNSNWIASSGDKFSLSLASALNLFANRKWGRNSWDNVIDVNYALVKTTSLGARKVNDRLDVVSKYGYQPNGWENVSISTLLQLRSQISNGYEYGYLGTTAKRRNSGFFAPAYITFAPVAIDWKPNSWLSVLGSPVVGRWTIVSNRPYSYLSPDGMYNGKAETPLAELYGLDPAKPTKSEFGAFITATMKKEIMKNVNYYSKIDLYSNYLKKAQNIDIFWTNQIRMKVNKWIQVSYTLDMLYDDDVENPLMPNSPLGLQVLSTLGVGFSAKF